MKKILSFLFLSLVLMNLPVASRLWSIPNLPIYTGDLSKVEYKIIAEDADVIIVVINGQEFLVKTEK